MCAGKMGPGEVTKTRSAFAECRSREGLECQSEEFGLPQTPCLMATAKGEPQGPSNCRLCFQVERRAMKMATLVTAEAQDGARIHRQKGWE